MLFVIRFKPHTWACYHDILFYFLNLIMSSRRNIPLKGIYRFKQFLRKAFPLNCFKTKSTSGFTLLECVVVIAIISILGIIIASNISGLRATWRLNSAARNLVADFNLARSQALKDGVNCVVRFDNNGYTVFRDDDEDFAPDKLYKTVKWADYGGALTSTNSFAGSSIAYRPDGLTEASGGGFGGGTITIRNSLGKQRRIMVSLTGTVRIQ